MKPVHNIFLTIFLSASVIALIFYPACKKDQCKNVTCLNLGSCDNGNCTCPVGYEGLRCDTLSRDKFIYNFNGGDTCGSVWDPYNIDFLADATGPLLLTMHHFLNDWDDSAVCTMRSTDSFTFTGSNNSATYSGNGKLYHDTLRMTYNVQIDTTNYSCTYIGGR